MNKELNELWLDTHEHYRREHIRGHPALVCVPKRTKLLFWKIKKALEG